MRIFRRGAAWLAAVGLMAVGLAIPAGAARHWHGPEALTEKGQSPREQAVDYVHIMDMRGDNEIVSVQWLSPFAMQVNDTLKGLLDQYVVIGVSHVSRTPGRSDIDAHLSERPTISDGDGTALEAVTGDAVPAPLAQLLADKLERLHNATLPPGRVAERDRAFILSYAVNLQFFVFRAGRVHDCGPGRMVIHYAGENYDFNMPIPGCAARPGI